MKTRSPLRTLIALTLTACCAGLAVAAAPSEAAACGGYWSQEEWTELQMRVALDMGDVPVHFHNVVDDGNRIHATARFGPPGHAMIMRVTFERQSNGDLVVVDRTFARSLPVARQWM